MKYLLSAISLLMFVAFLHTTTPNTEASEELKRVCTEQAQKNARDWENTKFKDFDWYTSCIDNIVYTSPLARR